MESVQGFFLFVFLTISLKNCQREGQRTKKRGKGQNRLSISQEGRGREEKKGLLTTLQCFNQSNRSVEKHQTNLFQLKAPNKNSKPPPKKNPSTEQFPFSFVHAQLTTSRKEHEVAGEEAGGGSHRPAIQEIDHVTHRVSRGEKSLEVQTAECNGVPVGKRAGDTMSAL